MIRLSEGALPPELRVAFADCPVKASLDVLGRKWAFLILRNIGLYRAERFSEMLRITPGLTKRVLAMRLRELERAGFLRAVERERHRRRWGLTEKGQDALPILMMMVQFGSKWYADEVFADHRPRALSEVFDPAYIQRTLHDLFARRVLPRARPGPRRSTPELRRSPTVPPTAAG